MTDYTDLVNWLRDNAIGVVSFRPKLIEAANAIEEQADRIAEIAEQYNSARLTPVPEKMLKDAIDEVICLRSRIEQLEAEILAGNHWLNARAAVLQELAEANARITRLEAALDKADAALSWMLLEGCDEAIPETLPTEYKSCVDALADLRAARAAMEGKDD